MEVSGKTGFFVFFGVEPPLPNCSVLWEVPKAKRSSCNVSWVLKFGLMERYFKIMTFEMMSHLLWFDLVFHWSRALNKSSPKYGQVIRRSIGNVMLCMEHAGSWWIFSCTWRPGLAPLNSINLLEQIPSFKRMSGLKSNGRKSVKILWKSKTLHCFYSHWSN